MTFNITQLKMALKLHQIPRAVIHPIIPSFNLSDHSIRVYALYKYFGGTEDLAAAYHDLSEVLTGDLPSPIKKELQGLTELYAKYEPQFTDPREKRLCKLCDKLCLVLQIAPYINFSPNVLEIYQEETENVLEIARELGKLSEVKKLIKELNK